VLGNLPPRLAEAEAMSGGVHWDKLDKLDAILESIQTRIIDLLVEHADLRRKVDLLAEQLDEVRLAALDEGKPR
jgi:hypothetical protein